MFTTTLTTLAAVAALHSQTIADAVTIPTASAVSAPEVTAVSTGPKASAHRVRIPGTFALAPDADVLDGIGALYAVRSGDGA